MMRLRIFLIVAILTPVPLLTHFVWPVSYCLKADFCNHTWIPDCGMENSSFVDYRLFIDECDMFEYNCDFNRTYELTNYSECFRANTGCPKYDKFYRMGNYKFVLEGKKMIYDPTRPTKQTKPPKTDHETAPSIQVPNLPMRMLSGKRRYTPLPKLERIMRRMRRSHGKMATRKTSKKMRKPTYLIRNVTVVRNGKMLMKVVKGFNKTKAKTTKKFDSDELE